MAVPARTPRLEQREAARIARRLEALVDLGFERSFVPTVQTESARVDARTARVTCGRPAMGTLVSVTAVGPSEDGLADAAGAAFEEMDRLVALLSRRDRASPVSHLNRGGRLDGPPPEVARVVRSALDFHRSTGGAFDVTVAPLVMLLESRADAAAEGALHGASAGEAGGGAPSPSLPTDAELREALALVGARHLAAKRRRISFERPGMAITLDGIAKGFIVDRIARVLDRRGVRRYLVNAGGDIRTRGANERGEPWTIAVRDPSGGPFPDAIRLSDGAVATSGGYEVHYDDARSRHHIVDASTGRSPDRCAGASVVAPDAMTADALATAVFVMGPEAGAAFVERLSGCACLAIGRDGRMTKSRGWRSVALPEGSEAIP